MINKLEISLKLMNRVAIPLLAAIQLQTGFAQTVPIETASSRYNQDIAKKYNLDRKADFSDAARGFIAKPTGKILGENQKVIWDFDSFNFLNTDAPETVNPSLWKQAQLNNNIGLFKVSDGIWQLRGFDLANMTLIEGKTGWIVVEALTSKETAQAALKFARQHLGDKPVSAIIFTHSHVDHFGGALGVLTPEQIASKSVPVIAPVGFMQEATSENLLAGPAMSRRAGYMYGQNLPRNAQGLVDNGLGKAVSFGTIGILEPTVLIDQPQQKMLVDGLEFIFYNVPHSEAPAELTFSIPSKKAYCGAEILSHTLHNLYTLRGAKVRDSLKWASYLDEALEHTKDSEVFFAQHHWPVWGNENIQKFIRVQRDSYKYIHDQTVRMMNAGLNGTEIAEKMQLPRNLDQELNAHGYYGTVKHNSKAVYQYYMGWFDANPANLDNLPPVEAAQRYIKLAGGEAQLLTSAQKAYDQADYRWAAELLKHALYNNPNSQTARILQAKTFSQLGYMSEASSWRNFYLTGAKELLEGQSKQGLSTVMLMDMLQYTPTERFLESMAASLNPERAADQNLIINLNFSDSHEIYQLTVANSILHYQKLNQLAPANTTLTLTKPFFLKMMTGQSGALDLMFSKETHIEGSRLDLKKFFSLFDKAQGNFPIVTRD